MKHLPQPHSQSILEERAQIRQSLAGKQSFSSRGSQDVTVEMIGAVGANDPYYASLLKPTLEKSGVSAANVVQEIQGVQTGTATILVDEGSNGENRILDCTGRQCKGC